MHPAAWAAVRRRRRLDPNDRTIRQLRPSEICKRAGDPLLAKYAVAYLGRIVVRIRRNRSASGPVVVNLGGQRGLQFDGGHLIRSCCAFQRADPFRTTTGRRMMLVMFAAGDLSEAERLVWDAFPTGQTVDFGARHAEDDDPTDGEGWGPDRQVRAEVLAALLCGAVEVEPGQAAQVCLVGARVAGKLDLPGVTLKHRLRLSKCYVGDGIDLSEATTRTLALRDCYVGAIRLYRATINGSLHFEGVHLDGKGDPALRAEGLTVTADMFCNDGFKAVGQVNLTSASIGGQLTLRGAFLDGKGRLALRAETLTVTADMFCDNGFHAEGRVHLHGARIGGQLSFSGAHLNGNEGLALEAESLTVTEDMFCDEGFRADGQVDLHAARIGAQLNFSGAHLNGNEGCALHAQRLTVITEMFCDNGFHADGHINLEGARIGGQLRFWGAHLDGKGGPALRAAGLTVTSDMFCAEGFQADGGMDLADAKIGTLQDERESWPQRLRLNGFTYDDLTYMPVGERLDWLNRSIRSVGYSPQPYEQLAAYYRRLGHDDEARRVLLAKQRERRRQRSWWARWWGWLQDALAGYGYAPGRAMLLLTGAFAAGWLVFSAHHPTPVGPGPHPAFNAALYTLNVLIPAPALGQASDFDPQGAGLAVAAGLHILGWLLAITVIAAITRSFSRS